MNYDSQKTSIDFFKKQISLEKSNHLKIWAMILFTTHQTLSRIKLLHFFILTVIVLSSIFVVDYIRNNDARAIIEHNQQVNKKLLEEKKVKANEEKKDIVLKQKVETIKKITPEQVNNIKNYLTKLRDKQVTKLNEVYWTYIFINEHDKKINLESVNKLVREQITEVNNFYKKRIFEVTSAYDFVKAGHIELVTPTHDNSDGFDKVITWDTLTKTDSAPYLPMTEAIISQSTEYLRSPVKLNKFLEENKEIIENNKIFK